METRWYLGEVMQVIGEGDRDDNYDGERLKIFINDIDKKRVIKDLPYALPLLPKLIHVKPKVGETVMVMILQGGGASTSKQRFYLGPVLSQPQFYKYCYADNSTSLFEGGTFPPMTALSKNPNTNGAFGENDDVSLYGRGNTDILLGANDVRIRCGSRTGEGEDITYNRADSSFLHLKYYEDPLWASKPKNNIHTIVPIKSTTTIVGEEINLISTNNSDGINFLKGMDEQKSHMISDEAMKDIVEKAHPLPYGDNLINLLKVFIKAFLNHQHNWGPCAPIPDDNVVELKQYNMHSILSKNIRIS